MKRRSFLTGAGLTAVAASTLPAPAIAAGKRKLKMVTTWPKNLPGVGVSAERLAKRIKALTEGKLDIKVYGAGQEVPPLQCFDAVSSGAADVYHGAEYYWQGKSPAFNFFTTVPFGMTADELCAWIYHGGGQELWDELSAGYNIKAMMAANTGVQMGGWFRNEINTLEDLKGLKMRMPGLGGEVFRRLGVAAVTMPGNEVYQALESGAIDATEWIGPWNDLALGFYQIAPYYYWPGIHEPGPALAAGWNLDVWNSFTDHQRTAIETACAMENDVCLADYNYHNAVALQTLVSEHNVKLRRFDPAILAALKKTSIEVVAEMAEKDPMTKKIHASFQKSLTMQRKWTRIADQAFLNARDPQE